MCLGYSVTHSDVQSPQPQQLALDFAPAQVRSHGLQDAHTYPQVARSQGASFRVPASQAWGYPSLELRAGNSWPLMGFDCDVPEKVLEALVSNHWGARSDAHPALPEPNMIVQRRSNSHSHVSFGSARSGPGREAAKRTLDGEDRSGIMRREGKKRSAPLLQDFNRYPNPLWIGLW